MAVNNTSKPTVMQRLKWMLITLLWLFLDIVS